ncbi:AmiS/UreI family transporter [Tamaricihabitans halophyticus]|uniref:AmiS/UreI family transporter n=1 Tax=Tamaricihabitans halophyticus TaxID=1262583 RepID=A0A4R2QYE5_9PSEU|nr:AmiS/UreI family transporter [Tamaricihabitans halophyticus]TCP55260.1 AmiS/UreI family transporter [Tamaricihabitans halophyticus]
MNNVGLIYVGAVLFLNGLMLLGKVTGRAAAPLNLFVGGLQCITPTVLIIQAGADTDAVFAASGLFLFGFTYLYVGIANLADLAPEGLGWFCLFVAVAAVSYAGFSFWRDGDPVFGVIWLAWALLWFLFFLVLGLGMDRLSTFTAWTVLLLSQPTTTLPAFAAMTGGYQATATVATVGALGCLALVGIAAVLAGRRGSTLVSQPAHT